MLYPHPLDYVTGMKYCLTSLKIKRDFKISSETFRVEELIDLSRYGFTCEKTGYAVLRAVKKDIDTLEFTRKLSKELNIPLSNILFMGLKDRNALTISYLFINHQLIDRKTFPILGRNFSVDLFGFIKKKPRRDIHIANKFVIKLPKINENEKYILKTMSKLMSSLGLPSYYGYQRFGTARYNTHILGKYIILGREDLFSKELLTPEYIREELFSRRMCGDLEGLFYERIYTGNLYVTSDSLLKLLRNMYIDAYASYLYNLLINRFIETFGYASLNKALPMPGCLDHREYYKELCEIEGLNTQHLALMPCFERNGLFYPFEIEIIETNNDMFYMFHLKPGTYATVVLREIFKEYLML